jgi:N-dimethylarginine dimethylaminohydrolase
MAGVEYATSDGGIELVPGYRHKLTKAHIGEWNLWGRLREVVVGTPEGTIIPRFEPVFEKAADPQVLKLMKEHEGELLKDVLPDYYAAIEEESSALAAVYESHGVKVHFPRPVKPEEVAYSFGFGSENVFPCDVFWCVGRNVIESSWSKMCVRPTRWCVRELYLPYVDSDPSVFLHACPMPAPGNGPGSGDYHFECSDILIVGDGNVILAYDSHNKSSNPRGCEWARRILDADGFKVTVVELHDTGITHLYAVICIIGPGVAIAYEGAFPGRKLPKPLKGWDVVWCDEAETRATAPCAVNIDRKTVLLPRNAPRVCEAVSKLGFNVVDLEFSAHAKCGGGIRCTTGVIYREID